jgi:hypothetical protein
MTSRLILSAARPALALFSFLLGTVTVSASDLATTAVFAWADKSYQRKSQPNGRPAREYYALSNGGLMPGTRLDSAVAAVPFSDVAGALAQHLGRQNYFLAPTAADANLLLVVHWGTTAPFSDTNQRLAVDRFGDSLADVGRGQDAVDAAFSSSGGEGESGIGIGADDAIRQQTDASSRVEAALVELNMYQSMRQRALLPTAQLLGYTSAMADSDDIRRGFTDSVYNQLMGELADPRYYIIVSAYDFRRTVDKKDPKLLWQTRISVTSRGVGFREHFNDMLASASRHYGKDSNKQLVRRYLRDVRVDIGEATVVEMVPDEKR